MTHGKNDQGLATGRGAWPKGRSGNPAGRRPGTLSFAERVRQRVDPDQLIDRAVQIISDPKTSRRDAIAAMGFLHSTGWSKPVEKHELAVTAPEPDANDDELADQLSDAELEALDALDRQRDQILSTAAGRAGRVLPSGSNEGEP